MGELETYVLAGRLDGLNASEHQRALEQMLSSHPAGVVLDMTQLDYISSAGLRVLLVATKAARAGGGDVLLKGPRNEVREVLEISGFDKILKFAD